METATAIVCAALALTLTVSTGSARAEGPVDLRITWQPGDVLTYARAVPPEPLEGVSSGG